MQKNEKKRLIEALAAVSFSLIVLAAVFYPAVFSHQLIYSEELNGSDSLDLSIPRRFLAVQSLLVYREFPLWEPGIGCGAPLFAESEAGVLHPSLLFFLSGDLTLANNLTILSAMLIAMLGSYAWSRCLGIQPLASGISSVIYGVGTPFLYQIQTLNILHVIAWLPASLALLTLYARNGARRYWFLLVIVWTLQLLASHFETFAICQMCCWLYILWLPSAELPALTIRRSRLYTSLLAALLLTALLGTVQILPTFEFTRHSTRSSLVSLDSLRFNSLHPEDLERFINPFFPANHNHIQIYQAKLWLNYQYIGILPLLLCLCTFVKAYRRIAAGLWITALMFFITSLGPDCGLYYLLWRWVPFISRFRLPIRFTIPIVCILGVLAAIGLQNVCAWLTSRHNKKTANTAAVICVLLICLERCFINAQTQGYLPSDWQQPPAGLQYIGSRQRIYSPYSSLTNATNLANQPPNGIPRQNIFWQHKSLISPGLSLLWNIEAPDDYVCYGGGISPEHSAGMQKAVRGLFQYIAAVPREKVEMLAAPLGNWLRVLGVTHIVTPGPLPEGWPKSEFSDLKIIKIPEIPENNIYIYNLARPLNKIRLVPRLQNSPPANGLDLAASFNLQLDSLYEPDFSRPADIGQVTVERSTKHTLLLTSLCDRDAFLVIGNTYDDNWQAWIDGCPVPVSLTNLCMQSLAVPAGKHSIELRYISPAFNLGRKISLSALLAFLALAAAAARHRSKTSAPADSPVRDAEG